MKLGEEYRGTVQGYNWKCVMENGAEFEIWTAFDLTRKQAREALLEFANSGGGEYDASYIERLWKNNNKKV